MVDSDIILGFGKELPLTIDAGMTTKTTDNNNKKRKGILPLVSAKTTTTFAQLPFVFDPVLELSVD